jgi:sodium/potassium-transporting ATPase subunit alpha
MDPPKETVPFAIKKCQSAGIRVIMVTGDQPPTAAAIAKQIGIVTMKTNEDLKEEGFTAEEALERAKAIVIHGDMIVKAYENGEEEGDRILENWCRKRQIVFARTTPAQKLLIVKANQRLGLICGVTGDGVNDSPAIKQGDIGISMGISGSDVTKDAADMILLNDDFASIVDGVEEGRKIFDNLKKTIVYLLTSNMTEIWPFVALVVVQIPLPLSNIFMLVICVGTDIYPALSLAYEEAEVDIMTRRPRKPEEHLVSAKLLGHAYGNMGELATCGGFFTYNIVMTCYGFPFSVYWELLSKASYAPTVNGGVDLDYNTPIVYGPGGFNPDAVNLNVQGYYTNACNTPNNPNLQPNTGYPYWLSTINNLVDLRAVFVECCSADPTQYCSQFTWPTDYLPDISPVSGAQAAFTTEALYYAQSGYFVTIVMIQWSNVFACKSRKVLFYLCR